MAATATLQHYDLLMRSSLFSRLVLLRLLMTFDLACSSRAGCGGSTSATAAGRHWGLCPHTPPHFATSMQCRLDDAWSSGSVKLFGCWVTRGPEAGADRWNGLVTLHHRSKNISWDISKIQSSNKNCILEAQQHSALH